MSHIFSDIFWPLMFLFSSNNRSGKKRSWLTIAFIILVIVLVGTGFIVHYYKNKNKK
jgi:hypothetical protein